MNGAPDKYAAEAAIIAACALGRSSANSHQGAFGNELDQEKPTKVEQRKLKRALKAGVVVVVGALGAAMAAPVMADQNQFYVTADVGQSKASDGCNGLPAGVDCKDTDTSFRLAGGYQFNPALGVEVGYVDLGKTKFSGFSASGDVKVSGFDVALVGTVPLGSNGFSVFGKLGFGRMEVKSSASNGWYSLSESATSTKARFGIGVQYEFTKTLAGRVQYDNFGTVGDNNTTGTAKMSAVSAGLAIKF